MGLFVDGEGAGRAAERREVNGERGVGKQQEK